MPDLTDKTIEEQLKDWCHYYGVDKDDEMWHPRRALIDLVNSLITADRQQILKKLDELWLNSPWSAQWSAEAHKIEGYRRAIEDIKATIDQENEP